MAQHPSFATADFSRLVIGGVGGAPMPVPLLKVWEARGVALQQGYGMTETSPAVLTLDKRGRRAQGRLLRQAGAAYRSADRSARWRRGRRRRTRRTLGQGAERHARLLEPARRQRVILHRRLAAHRRRHARSTRKASTTSSIAGRTCTFPAARTSIRPRSRTCCTSLPPIAEAAVIGIPNEQWGEVGMAIVAVKPGHTLTRCGNPCALRRPIWRASNARA